MAIGGFGSEGVVALSGWVLIREVFIPLYKKVIIPWWAKKVLKKEPRNPNDTLRRLNPNSITLAKVVTSLKKHEEMDEKRTDKLESSIEKVRDTLVKHGERLAGLESPGR